MYNVSLIGHGYWGEKLARNFQNSKFFNIVSIVDKNKRNLILSKKEFPFVKFYKDYRKTIEKDLIDLVIISTPTSSHYEIAEYALNNLKHILVEKPLSMSLKETKKLNNIAKKNKKMIFVDYPFLFSGSINFIKKIIDKNKYGKILEIESFREQAPIRKDANVIWDLGTHDVSILLYLLNKFPSTIITNKKNNAIIIF